MAEMYTEDATYGWNVGPNDEFMAVGRDEIREYALGLEMEGLGGWTYPYQRVLIDDVQGEILGLWKQVADATRPDGSHYEIAGLGGSWFRYGGNFQWSWQRDFFDVGNATATFIEMIKAGVLTPGMQKRLEKSASGSAARALPGGPGPGGPVGGRLGTVESVWDYPAHPSGAGRKRASGSGFGGQTIADTTAPTGSSRPAIPQLLPAPADIVDGCLADPGSSFCEWKGTAHYYDVTVGEAVATEAAWGYDRPPGPSPHGRVRGLLPGRMDAAWSTTRRWRPSRAASTAVGSPPTWWGRSRGTGHPGLVAVTGQPRSVAGEGLDHPGTPGLERPRSGPSRSGPCGPRTRSSRGADVDVLPLVSGGPEGALRVAFRVHQWAP